MSRENKFYSEHFNGKNWFQKMFYRFNLAFAVLLGKGVVVIRIDNIVQTNEIDYRETMKDCKDKRVYDFDLEVKSAGVSRKVVLCSTAIAFNKLLQQYNEMMNKKIE